MDMYYVFMESFSFTVMSSSLLVVVVVVEEVMVVGTSAGRPNSRCRGFRYARRVLLRGCAGCDALILSDS